MLDKSEAHKASAFGAWELPEELQQLRDTVRRFMVNEVKPVEDKLEHDAVQLRAGRPESAAGEGARSSACGCCARRPNTAAPASTCSARRSSPRKPQSAGWAPTSLR